MMRPLCLIALLTMYAVAVHAQDLGPPVDLLEGLETGAIWAQFWGGGETGVNGIIGRDVRGPREVTIAPGTQFWAQTPGRQGMTTLGGGGVGLGGRQFMQVWIPTACTNINLRAPTEDDIMFPSPSPNPDMTRLTRSLALDMPPQPIVQVAVWAIANDPPPSRLLGYLRREARASQGALTVDGIMHGAAQLLERAGLDPAAYRMFR